MDKDAIWQLLLQALFADIDPGDEFYNKKPFLAHYTSLDVLENILATDEIWFSNPLFMNDLEEVKWGVVNGCSALKQSETVSEALATEARHRIFTNALDYQVDNFDQEHLLDTYVFCLSEHDPENEDGMLSMWRGYGGNGKGAAIVIDTSKLDPTEGSPLTFARVRYGSEDERLAWFDKTASTFASFLVENQIPDDQIYLASAALLERIKFFALFTKHRGFEEEKEWRVAYMSERDPDGKLKPMQHYLNGPRGVEPKLKLKVGPIEGVTPPDLSLDKILASIVLGPSTSSALAVRSIERMLDLIEKPKLKDRLVASSIPIRAA